MKQTVKNYSKGISLVDLDELSEIARRYSYVKNEVFDRYGSIAGLHYLSYPRQIRDEWVKAGCADKFGLQARYWKQAFDEAWANIKTNWSLCFRKVRRSIHQSENLTQDEKKYCYYLLKSPSFLYKVITNQSFEKPPAIADLEISPRVNKWLKSKIRKYQNKKPHDKKMRSFVVDSAMYSYSGEGRLEIMSLVPHKRISLKLSSRIEFEGDLRIVLRGNRVEVHYARDIEPEQIWEKEREIAIDKGFTTLITTSEGGQYGTEFSQLLKTESNRLSDKGKRRNKLVALAKKYERQGKHKKARNIQRFNLGRRKHREQKAAGRARVESYVNQSLNQFYQTSRPSTLIVENLNFKIWARKLSKKVKRYFSSWLKGYLQERIDFKSGINGVALATVNPAYSSQTCSFCGYLDRDNRNGDRFHCLNCGRVLQADHSASLNLLQRLHDPEITVFTPYAEVKRILEDRFRASVGGSLRATGSTRTPDTLMGQSESELLIFAGVCADL